MEALFAKIEQLVELQRNATSSANARASSAQVMLRLLLQELVRTKVIDGPRLEQNLQAVAAKSQFDSEGEPSTSGAAAQHTYDQAMMAFLEDLRSPANG